MPEVVEKIDNPEVIENPVKNQDAAGMLDKAKDILNSISQNDITKAAEEAQHIVAEAAGSKKICTVKFLFGREKEIAYRLDLYSRPDLSNPRVVEIRNAINNFGKIAEDLPPRKLGQFLAAFGLIRYVFPKTMFPIDDSVQEDGLIITLENQINSYIKTAKIKELEIKIDRE